jgi:hypothetical protein
MLFQVAFELITYSFLPIIPILTLLFLFVYFILIKKLPTQKNNYSLI